MNTLKRKNHYVPRLYLSHWANNGELFEYISCLAQMERYMNPKRRGNMAEMAGTRFMAAWIVGWR